MMEQPHAEQEKLVEKPVGEESVAQPLSLDPMGDTGDINVGDVLAAFEIKGSDDHLFILLLTKRGARTAPMSESNRNRLSVIGWPVVRAILNELKSSIEELGNALQISEQSIPDEEIDRLKENNFSFIALRVKDNDGVECAVIEWKGNLWWLDFAATYEQLKNWQIYIDELREKVLRYGV